MEGSLSFRQYIPGKRHKYGIKAYKLCLPEGYIYNFEIYAGKNAEPIAKTHSHDVVIKLIRDLLFEGRTLFTDSFYTSIPLAEELMQKKNIYLWNNKKEQKISTTTIKAKASSG